MNALTGSDYTVYPFATTNAVDYKNLQGVYMDAAFHPLLTELDYKQEGWRLEHDDLTGKAEGNVHSPQQTHVSSS